MSKYALKDDLDRFLELTPVDMHHRLAREFARVESSYPNPMSEDEVFTLFSSWKAVPQGSPMSAIGNPYQVQSLSNCFVLESPYDSYGGILKTDHDQVQIMKRRGGVGFDLSTIRPRGMKTSNAAGTTDGIGVFMERYSQSTREVAQGGRRGALMLSISVNHPEVETFINIKRDGKRVTGANVSVRVTDEFMKAVVEDREHTLRWPVDNSPEDAVVTKVVKAKQVWEQIVSSAWESAEPGVLFWDTVQRETPSDIFADKGFKSVSTNPCGEIVLSALDSCRLLLLNLTKYVNDPFTDEAGIDEETFRTDVMRAQHLMDDLVDLELEAVDRIIEKIKRDPEPENVKKPELTLWRKIRTVGAAGRRTGLGMTGLGDALAMCGVKYGSDESIDFVDGIYRILASAAHESSVQLAEERGAFPACEPSRYAESHPYFDRLRPHINQDVWKKFMKIGRRNIAISTTAPCGSVSLMTQTTSGIEPVFLLSYKRRKKVTGAQSDRVDFVDAMGDKWQEYDVVHHGLSEWMKTTGKTDVSESPYWGASSADVDWLASVRLQAAAQKHIEHSISKTINLPREATKELVNDLYFEAWKSGCKGCTIYRDGCRSGVLVSNDQANELPRKIAETHAPKRPRELTCDVHRATVKGEPYVVLVGLLDDRPYEVFAGLSNKIEIPKKLKRGTLVKNGKNSDGIATYNLIIDVGDDDSLLVKDVVDVFDNPVHGSFTRTISLALRHGVPVSYLCTQLKKDKSSDVTSFSSAIARVLSKSYVKDGTKAVSEGSCAQCGSSNLSYREGCVTCAGCGWSRCS